MKSGRAATIGGGTPESILRVVQMCIWERDKYEPRNMHSRAPRRYKVWNPLPTALLFRLIDGGGTPDCIPRVVQMCIWERDKHEPQNMHSRAQGDIRFGTHSLLLCFSFSQLI